MTLKYTQTKILFDKNSKLEPQNIYTKPDCAKQRSESPARQFYNIQKTFEKLPELYKARQGYAPLSPQQKYQVHKRQRVDSKLSKPQIGRTYQIKIGSNYQKEVSNTISQDSFNVKQLVNGNLM